MRNCDRTGRVLGLLVPQIGRGQSDDQLNTAFGPQLFAIEMPAGQWPATVPPTTVLHAAVEEGDRTVYIASGSPKDLAALQKTGAAAACSTITRPASRVPLAVPITWWTPPPTMQRNSPRRQARCSSTTPQPCLSVRSTESELTFVEQLTTQGVPVSLLSAAPLAPPTTEGMLVGAAGANATRDPNVDYLLPRLTEADLRAMVDGLSGQKAVTVGGTAVTLNTRYTFSARIRDAEAYVYQYYQTLGIPVIYSPWTYGNYSGRNVIAEVRGAVEPNKVLLVGGHLDNISQIPYTTAPGADDNATGTAATMLIARLLKTYPPDFTVRFVHFTGEEQGQWGSKVYAALRRGAASKSSAISTST